MKKILIATLAVCILAFGATAFAASQQMGDKEVDASVVLGTAPVSGFNTGFGINVGGGMMLPQVAPNLQGRVELSYMTWSASEFGVSVTYTRIPIAAAGRYFIPLSQPGLKVYVQGGIEISMDTVEAAATNPFTGTSYKASASETNFGITPGVGIDYSLKNNLSIVADARYHIITDGYLTLQAGVAYHF